MDGIARDGCIYSLGPLGELGIWARLSDSGGFDSGSGKFDLHDLFSGADCVAFAVFSEFETAGDDDGDGELVGFLFVDLGGAFAGRDAGVTSDDAAGDDHGDVLLFWVCVAGGPIFGEVAEASCDRSSRLCFAS